MGSTVVERSVAISLPPSTATGATGLNERIRAQLPIFMVPFHAGFSTIVSNFIASLAVWALGLPSARDTVAQTL